MNLQEAFYEQKFEIAYLRAKADTFQEFFERLMALAYKADFMPCRPWGNRGDRKNDGFLKSERRLFQVYAPNEMTESKAINKITEDFEGAKAHWGEYFDKWVFAHNSAEGLPPHIHTILLKFENDNPGITLEPWGLEEFRIVFRRLTIEDLQSWFGFAPTEETKVNLGLKDLQVILERLAGQTIPSGQTVETVPIGKIEANALSESVAQLLKAGIAKSPLVQMFFEQWHDPYLGEKVAEEFRTKYKLLREQFTPNQIFTEFQIWVGGENYGSPEYQLAVLAVIAHFFQACDIFEGSKGGQV